MPLAALGEEIEVARALIAYRRTVVPAARRELRAWRCVAESIPDPVLRAHAVAAARDKARNAEATAVFAILAPRRNRPVAIRAMTAFQVVVDYLDTLGEQAGEDPLGNGLALHRALSDALSPGEPASDWYRLNSRREDGGYLSSLVSACRDAVQRLPASGIALPAARRAADRCAQGQSYTHAAELGDPDALASWASQLESPPGYAWWEVAAGASSSVAVHALIAAAANPGATAGEAALIDAVYFPPVGALTVFLDDLVDLEEDAAGGRHNYLGYYPSNGVAADRLGFVADRAKAAAAKLGQGRRHAAILAGVAGFYLGSTAARSDYASPIRGRLLDSLGGPVRMVTLAMRAASRA